MNPTLKAKKKRNYFLIAFDTPSGAQYKWYHNGELIARENKQYYIVPNDKRTGTYLVEITGSDGCSNKSNILTFNKYGEIEGALRVDDENESLLYPNPASENVNLQISIEISGTIQIMFYDISGRLVKSMEVPKEGIHFEMEIPLNEFNIGVYFVKIKIGDEFSGNHRLIVE